MERRLFASRPLATAPFTAALLAAALLAAALSSCTATPRTPALDDAGTSQPLVGRSCNVDTECGELRCDAIRHQCICLADADCARSADGAFCNNFTGLCVATINGCKTDGECSASSYCEQQTRSCKVRKGFCDVCTDDRECGGAADDCLSDKSLNVKFCGSLCTSDGDCPTGATCQDFAGKKQCWPKAGKNCKTFTGCIPDSRKTCQANADCADVPDQVCDPGSGVCTARLQLCPFGQVCDSRSRVCVDACNTDADCTAIDSRLRCVNRGCEPVGECTASAKDPSGDQSCPANKVCSIAPGQQGGNCVPFCSSNNDCPQGSICQRTADNRSKCLPGCVANADCPLDKRCVKGGTATVGTCQGTPGQTCQTDSVCPTCNFCDIFSNQCQTARTGNYCKPCSGDSECGSGLCLALKDGKRCGQPCPASGCPRGFVCGEICLGTYQGYLCQGTRVAQCIPADQSCSVAGINKCGF